jgi:hypothetical protein
MDNSRFDHANVKNLWFDINGKRYPEGIWELNFDDDYCAYDAFHHFQRRFVKTDSPPYIDSIPYMDENGFKDMYPIYSVDLTNQPEKMSGSKKKIMLHVDFSKAVSPLISGTNEGTTWYIALLSDCILHYEPVKNKITQVE